jgi:hypothetical protein
VADTANDKIIQVLLPAGTIYSNKQGYYYLYSKYPVGEKCKGVIDDSGELKWISVLTADELISILADKIKSTTNEFTQLPGGVVYDVKVYENDTIQESYTDKRGYPKSCGKVYANRRLIIIIKGDQV